MRPTEASPELLDGARAEVKEAVQNGKSRRSFWRSWGLVLLGLSAAALVGVVLFLRAYTTEATDRVLCEKIDRFVVALEYQTVANPELTDAAKQARIDFYEDFRNDSPTCRTAPAPKVEGR
jgi:hypothetical protein